MSTEQEQSTIIEENKTVETTTNVDGDKTVDSSTVDKTTENECVMTEEAELEAKLDNSKVEQIDEQANQTVDSQSKEESKVEEVEMADSTEQQNKSNVEDVEKPKDVELKDTTDRLSDVHMDQVITDVKDSVLEKSTTDALADKSVKDEQPVQDLNTNSQEPVEQQKIDENQELIAAAKTAEPIVPPPSNKKPKLDVSSMQTRQYLDHTVVPILLTGLSSLAKARPENPIEYLANYLLDNKTKYDNNQENQSLNGN